MITIIPTIIEWAGKISAFVTLEAEIRQCVHSVSDYRSTQELKNLYADIDFSTLDEEWAIYADKADRYIAKRKAQIIGQNLFSDAERIEFVESFFEKNMDVLPYRDYVEPILKNFLNRLEKLLLKAISLGDAVIIQKLDHHQSALEKISKQIDALNSTEPKVNEDHTIFPQKKSTAIESKSGISNNTEKIFQQKYFKRLFFEEKSAPIYLCDVYVEPKLIEKNLNNKGRRKVGINVDSTLEVATLSENIDPTTEVITFTEGGDNKPKVTTLAENINKKSKAETLTEYAIRYICRFTKKEENDKALFIEGAAGVGKSSLLSKLSTVLYGKDIFYKSLKDYLNTDRIRLRRELTKSFLLTDNDYGKTFLLDGLDEIWNRMDPEEFEDDLKFFLERSYKIVFTVRPGYVQYSKYAKECQLCSLEIFGEQEKKKWLDKYKVQKKDLTDKTIKSILEDTRFRKITGIPIMLYIIANRNIDVRNATSMPALYEQVFNSLKEDKGKYTQRRLENDYVCAQKIAYEMQSKEVLAIHKGDLLSLLPINDSLYSSVYIDKIIDGEDILQFVHKSIQEFFAARWIYNQARSKDYIKWAQIFCEHIFSKELLANLRFFYSIDAFSISPMCNKFICEGFPFFKEGRCNWKNYAKYVKNILTNVHNFYTEILHSDMEVTECQDMGTFFEVTDYAKWSGNAKDIRGIKFTKCLFEYINIRNYNFYNLDINNCRFISCVFENTSFFQCSLDFCASETDIIFRRCQFNNIRLYTNMNRIRFEECTFVLYDSKTAKETATEIQKCKLDEKSFNDLKKTVEYYGK